MEYSQSIVGIQVNVLKRKRAITRAIVDGIPNCYYPLLQALDAPFRAGTSITWIEGARSAFGLYELPNGHEESQEASENEQFYYVLEDSGFHCGQRF